MSRVRRNPFNMLFNEVNSVQEEFARALLTSSGSNFRDPPVNFYRALPSRGREDQEQRPLQIIVVGDKVLGQVIQHEVVDVAALEHVAGEQAAHAGDGELPEADVAAPAGEDHQRHADDGPREPAAELLPRPPCRPNHGHARPPITGAFPSVSSSPSSRA